MSESTGGITRQEECGEATTEKSTEEKTCTEDELVSQRATDIEQDMDKVMDFSDLSDNTRNIWIVTTAALPWRTGTSINPFLRALYFVRRRLRFDAAGKISGKITLVIPWLENKESSMKLYQGIITEGGETGKDQQTKWIKKYAIECGMVREIEHLHIFFYDAEYWTSFGSIFPMKDICAMIPDGEADIAILEEPEHLNWFRVPDLGNESVVYDSQYGTKTALAATSFDMDRKIDESGKSSRNFEVIKLGWARKFRFVVGIIHTNYTAYVKQYGIGTSILGAPAIERMSSMVVQAYCHKVIRLSSVIPHYAPWKEVTENVHGVREDFLLPPKKASSSDDQYAPIYFIGKLLWAKGFDLLLKIEEKYRKANNNDEYFQIDIYGDGPDKTAIKRAFHGRRSNRVSNESNRYNLGYSRSMDDIERSNRGWNESHKYNLEYSRSMDDIESFVSLESYDNGISDVFDRDTSLRDQLKSLSKVESECNIPEIYKDAQNYINMGFELVIPNKDDAIKIEDIAVLERRQLTVGSDNSPTRKKFQNTDPFSIISDVSKRTINTGVSTTLAVKNLADNALQASFDLAFSLEINESQSNDEVASPTFKFDPPQSIYELRRIPVPAKFLGVKDHALLRDLPHKIFLNPSITEVLCTTTAEALSMNKFVIIPLHPSNEFFMQFPNCLVYSTDSECVEKITWALSNEPTPLSEEHARIFTWEAATERLIKSSAITVREMQTRKEAGNDKQDSRMAWFHSESGTKIQAVKNLLRNNEMNANLS